MPHPAPKFQEEYSSKLPALTLLTQLGWQFIPPQQALEARNGRTNQVVLQTELRKYLQKYRFQFAGKEYPLSEKSIANLIAEISTPALNEGLRAANQRIYDHLLYGISVTEFIDGKRTTPTIALIDWENPDNNSFVMTEEFSVTRVTALDHRRPDIVCFVNGIPLVVIEAKRPDGNAQKGPTINEGISQTLRNQRQNEIPQLFAYSQLLLSINGSDARYGTCETPAEFWALWHEEDISTNKMQEIKNRKLNEAELKLLFSHRSKADLNWYKNLIKGGELALTGQDRLIISLLTPERLLEMMRYFVLHDNKNGKIIARYQQVFGIKRLIEQVSKHNSTGGREGGVIWHTTGSGKSYTMVFLSKALIFHDSLKQCRLLVITDRIDLENQLSKTFASGGELSNKRDIEAAMATSGTRLAVQIGKGNERIVFSLIQKFNTAIKRPECVNTSADIIVLIDEGHRSQGGENYIHMRRALPNASFVAFTGTPLLQDDKTTNKFGPIVHAYTMQRAVADKMVTPLLYEERVPDLDINERALDSWFERITEGLTDAEKGDLKRKFSQKKQMYGSNDRIQLIALDIANHFSQNIDEGLKGQLACDSKLSAIRYKHYLDEAGLFESAVVMSPPDTREGNRSTDEDDIPEVTSWWKNHVGSQDEQQYTKSLIERFANDDKLKLLIVVDKLLTGFDEPKNSVLYIDKSLKQHNLIQAIARVNRLHPLKKFGLLIDYRGILSELDTTIAQYQDLASRTQGGYAVADIEGQYRQMSTEYKRLPHLYKQLWEIFANVKNKSDIEQLRQALIPRIEEQNGEWVDVNLKIRDDFYDALSAFANCLKIALQSATFYDDKSFSDQDRRQYKETVKQLSNLRQLIQHDAGEKVDYNEYAAQMKKLLDKHVVGVGIKEPDGVLEVNKMGQQEAVENWSDEKARNETDTIKTRIARTIEHELQDDPYAQEAFSKLLRQTIEDAEKLFDSPLKQYLIFLKFEEQVNTRQLDELPELFKGNHHAQAFYGVFKKLLPKIFTVADKQVQEKWVQHAFAIEQIVDKSIAENSINPQNIEASIRNQLLPMMFKECKAIGDGMEKAKEIVEMVVQITRIRLLGGQSNE